MIKEISISGFVLFILYTSFSSCIRDKMSQFDLEMQKANCCGFKQEIHKTRTGGLAPSYLFIKDITTENVLKDISKGVDSFEFRVWYPCTVDTIVVFVLNYEQEWQCRLYKHCREFTEQGKIKNYWEKKKYYTADIKFKSILDTLAQDKIFLLKHYLDLKDYDIATPDDEIIFEIAGRNFYRCISYAGLMRQSGKIPEVVAARSIIRFFDKKFDTKIVEGLKNWSY
jgi:hypothetical protein